MIGILAVTACSSPEKDDVPDWVRSPPGHLSCGGVAAPELMVDLIHSADLGPPGKPDPAESDSEVDAKELEAHCSAVGPDTLRIGVWPAKKKYMSTGLEPPPDPLLVPIGRLPGYVAHDYANIYAGCTQDGKTVTLENYLKIAQPPSSEADPPKRETLLNNPRERVAMARLLVDTVNRARDEFGCEERTDKLAVPSELPNIPDIGPPGDPEEYYAEHPPPDWCDPRHPRYRVGSSSSDMQPWVIHTPEPSGLVSTCEIRQGVGGSSSIVPGQPKEAFVTYKGVLARARQQSEDNSWPRYDITCDGEPISYRLFVEHPDESRDYLTQRPDSEKFQERLENAASAAAKDAGCPLPDE